MNKLKELMSLCKCGVYVYINTHRDIYCSVASELADEKSGMDSVIYDKMIELDTIIHVQCFPDTPIGSYTVYHYDLDDAIDLAVKYVKEGRP